MEKRLYTAVVLMVWALSASSVWADEKADAQNEVDKALQTLKDFKDDPDMGWFRDHMSEARALLIVPAQVKGGFIFGGSGGRGVLVERENGKWVGPAFYTMGSGSVGLQAGVEVSEVILIAVTEKGVDAFLNTKMQVGADVSIAAGPVGTGAQAATADILGFVRSKGAYAGMSFEGAVITPDDSRNRAYYGENATPVDILVRHTVSNNQASQLLQEVAEMH